MELRKAKSFGVFDDNDRRFGDVYSYFDDGRGNEHTIRSVFELLHGFVFIF